MGGDKKKTQQKAQATADQAAADERQRAATLQTQLEATKSNVTNDVYGEGGSRDLVKSAATNLAVTGGYTPEVASRLRGNAQDLITTGGYDPNQLSSLRDKINDVGSSEGYGREGYQSLADTGGYSDIQKNDFLESAVAPTIAKYGRNRDELTRRLAINGGYSPGYTSSQARMDRQQGEDVSSAAMTGRVNLASMIERNKEAGLSGLSSTQQMINQNKLSGINASSALEGNLAQNKMAGTEQAKQVENNIVSGKVAGADMLQKYNESGVQSLNQNDILQLQNRLQSGNMTMADSQLLLQLSSQQKTLYDNIMQGISTVGGAVAGVAAGFK